VLGKNIASNPKLKLGKPYCVKPYTTEHNLHRGEHLYQSLGAHLLEHQGSKGVNFSVWAPNAASVCVIGDFNQWDYIRHPMRRVSKTGVWELFIPELGVNSLYKFSITAADTKIRVDKSDPFAFASALRPETASRVSNLSSYTWNDTAYLKKRKKSSPLDKPISVYEVHLGSWRLAKTKNKDKRWLSYRELAKTLIPYVKDMGYTHIEPLPITEHPYDGSWGYQVTGLFCPTSRFGSSDDFKYFIDQAHLAGLGIILDWVPGHFPKDEHGLSQFDGSALYEHADPTRSENLQWGTSLFNLDKKEVREFLTSSAYFWFKEYHIDGLRVDAVSSMVYSEYSITKPLNQTLGLKENSGAVTFFKTLNSLIHTQFPGTLMIAEESTAILQVTGPKKRQSLGFDLKWNMGWMHDTLGYFSKEPVHRKFHHNEITFSMVYAFKEAFMLALSHDEVVHEKRPLLLKMPGKSPDQFAHLRSLLAYMFSHPGKKLLFMGSELGVTKEWNESSELNWDLLNQIPHKKLQKFVRQLNRFYQETPALYENDFNWEGFKWISADDKERSILSFIRIANKSFVISVSNFTQIERKQYRLGVPKKGTYTAVLSSDALEFGGSSKSKLQKHKAVAGVTDNQPYSITIDLPPLSTVYYSLKAE